MVGWKNKGQEGNLGKLDDPYIMALMDISFI